MTAPSWLSRAEELRRLLRDPGTRSSAVAQVDDLARRTTLGEETELQVHRVQIDLGELSVLTLPSIFAPEDWGRTFLRGLLARPREAWRGKSVVELGTGSGWVAIALAKFTSVARVYALDLNPHAALVTEINAWLAGADPEGKPVAEKIEPGVSDLLKALEEKGTLVDLVCGNIPQVLGPEAVALAESFTDDAEARALRMLADYTPPTGNWEDVLSLGLIASALERALPRLRPSGRIVLNLAGRPGFDAIRWVFARWGYAATVLHKARIRQDPTTDIAPFARSEEQTGRRFSFFATRDSRTAITAREALQIRKQGKDVFHDLYVVEGQPYADRAHEGARRFLEEQDRVPYTDDPGTELPGLRDEASVYLTSYLRLAARPDEVFVAPDIEELIEALGLAALERGGTALVELSLAPLARDLERAGLSVRIAAGPIEAEIEERDGLVLATLGSKRNPFELSAPRLARLVERCREKKKLLVLVATHLPIASTRREPDEREKLIDGLWRTDDVVLAFDLAEHLSAREHPLALALVGARYRAVMHVGDALWSRAATVPQAAHRHLLASLVSRYRGPRPTPVATTARTDAPASSLARELALMPAFADTPRPAGVPIIRLDFGESEFTVSERLRKGWLAGGDPRGAAARFLATTRGVPAVDARALVFGRGAQEILGGAIAASRETASSTAAGRGQPLVLLPSPYYGMFPAIVLAQGAELATLATSLDADGRLALDVDDLARRLDRAAGRPAVLLLPNPNNPLGTYVSDLERIVATAHERKAWTVADEVFFTLRHSPRGAPPESALNVAARRPGLGERLVVVEGLSKAFAAGGVRLGFAWAGAAVRGPLGRAVRAPLAGALGAAAAQLADFEADLAAHVAWLGGKARQTTSVLRELGLEHFAAEGGLFVTADLTPLESRDWVGTDAWGREPDARPADFRSALARAAGLVVSPDGWLGWERPHRRLVFSIRNLDEALVRLRAARGLFSQIR